MHIKHTRRRRRNTRKKKRKRCTAYLVLGRQHFLIPIISNFSYVDFSAALFFLLLCISHMAWIHVSSTPFRRKNCGPRGFERTHSFLTLFSCLLLLSLYIFHALFVLIPSSLWCLSMEIVTSLLYDTIVRGKDMSRKLPSGLESLGGKIGDGISISCWEMQRIE